MSDSMVKSAAEYEYVTGAHIDAEHPHGDLDRIQIDGNVMPLRGDEVVRGEDIAFLMEFAMQRLKMIRRAIYAEGGTNYTRKETECVVDWPCATTLSCTFSDTIDAAAFGDDVSGLYGLFSELASKVIFSGKLPHSVFKKTPVNLSSFAFPKGIFNYTLNIVSLDPKELAKATDLSGETSSILKSSVAKYFSWVDADKYLKYSYALFDKYFTLLTGFYSGDYATYDLVVGTEGTYVNSDSSSMHLGASRYRYNYEDVFELYCYPTKGVPLLTLVCDHASSVSSLIVLSVTISTDIAKDGDYNYTSSSNDYYVVLRGDFENTNGSTFVLRAETMASRDFMKELINKCDANWYSQEFDVQAHMSLRAYVFPIIKFDSHTTYHTT